MRKRSEKIKATIHAYIIKVGIKSVMNAQLFNKLYLLYLSLFIDNEQNVLIGYRCILEACSNFI